MSDETEKLKTIDITCIRCSRSISLNRSEDGTQVFGTCPICGAVYVVNLEHTPFR